MNLLFPAVGRAKKQALSEAGLSTSQAHRCEEMAGIDEAEFEAYLAECRERKRPARADAVKRLLAACRTASDRVVHAAALERRAKGRLARVR